MSKFLVIVDMQKDFITGSLGSSQAVEIVSNVAAKIEGFDGECLFTFDTHNAQYLNSQEGKNLPVEHCIKGEAGWELDDALAELSRGKRSFEKPTFGSVELAQYLVGENAKSPIESIELIGLCTDICVISNALLIKAFLPEAEIIVDASCCAGVTGESHETALKAMQSCQIKVTR
ncbi:MAG: cysteine hydrolase [Eubacteriaceae bacterium]|nr:cysteine hydrolase [Eubacteriaceae bacterium]